MATCPRYRRISHPFDPFELEIPLCSSKKEDGVASSLLFQELSLIINPQHHLYALSREPSLIHNCSDNVNNSSV